MTVALHDRERQEAVDRFFAERPGWSRFNLEACFLTGWSDGVSGKSGSGGYLANTTERVVYDQGRLAGANWRHFNAP